MKKRVFILLFLFIEILIPVPSQAVGQLILSNNLPAEVDGNTEYLVVQLSLPPSVVLKANTDVQWDYSTPQLMNEFGDLSSSEQGRSFPVKINVNPSSRNATYTVSSSIAGKIRLDFSAKVDNELFTFTKEIEFLTSNSGAFVREKLPKLPQRFAIQIENPNPGQDQQSTIRARFTWIGNFDGRPWSLSWFTSSGELVEEADGWPEQDNWKNFKVSLEQYMQSNFVLKAKWLIAQNSTNSAVYFERDFPIKINFANSNSPIPNFQWNFLDESIGPVSSYLFSQADKTKLGIIKFASNVDWSKTDPKTSCLDVRFVLQYQESGKWRDELDYGDLRKGSWAQTICRKDSYKLLSGQLALYPPGRNGKFLNISRNYRIWSVYQNQELTQFKVTFKEDPTARPYVEPPKVMVKFPQIVEYGKYYTAVAIVNPAFKGSCSFSLYYFGDIGVGSARIINGKATLKFKVLWPKESSTRKSLKAVCTGGNYKAIGGTLFIGTNP